MTTAVRLETHPQAIDARAVDAAGRLVRAGGVVAFPTDTLYGLAADPFSAAAVQRVFEVKGRGAERALPLVAAEISQIEERIGTLSPLAARLARRFWPGPLTLLILAPATLAPNLTGGTGRVGVRVPDHPVARALCRACGGPLTATSANRTGEPATEDPDEVIRSLGNLIDGILDGGRAPGGAPSTVIDAVTAAPRLVRAGAIAWEDVQRFLCDGTEG
jgi:L-threonylcarbamoyladenylate synthase